MIPSDNQCNKKHPCILHVGRALFQQIKLWGLFCFLAVFLSFSAKANQQVENFRITKKTLQTLRQENVPPSLLEALDPLLNQLYTSKAEFLKILQNIQNPVPQAQQIDLILKHAMLNKLWVQSEKTRVDLEKGESLLTGSVRGGIPKDNIIFSADKVRIVTEGSQRYNKIIAESNVRVIQLQREITADRAIYNRTTQKLDLVGSVVIKYEGINLYGATANLDRRAGKVDVRGNSNQRVMVEYTLNEAGTPSDAPNPQPSIIQAQRALLDNQQRLAIFEGNVEMTRPQLDLYLRAGRVILVFNEARELLTSTAEQDVCLEQPGRAARADKVQLSETNHSIFLEGNAEINRKGVYLNGPTINLFLDVEQGEAIGDSATPVRMIIPLDEESSEQSSSSQYFVCQ